RVSVRRAPHVTNISAPRTARRLQQLLSRQRSSLLALRRAVAPAAFRQIGIEKAKHVRALDRAHAFLLLQVFDASAEFFHFSPVNLWAEMMFGGIGVVEK